MLKTLKNLIGFPTGGDAAPAANATTPTVNNAGFVDADSGTMSVLYFSPGANAAGVPVTPENAMRVSAVYACVRIIGGSIASLPLHIYDRTPDGRKRADVPLWFLFNEQPSPNWTAAAFWEYVIACVLLLGDGFAMIRRNKALDIVEIIPLDPNAVIVDLKNGELVYYVQTWDGERLSRRTVIAADMLHFPGLGFNGVRSPSVIQSAAINAIGTAISAEQFAGRFFANGAMPSYIFEVDGKMDAEQQEQMRASFQEKVSGTNNAFKPFVTTQGVKLREISINPEDSQLMEARKFQVIDIARAFGVPPFMIGETEKTSSWGSGVEHMSLGYLKYTLQPHLSRWEQEINRKCFMTARRFAEFSVVGLLRGDDKGRSEYYRQALGGSQGPGWMTTNEIRRLENLPPIAGGNRIYNPNETPPSGSSSDDDDDTQGTENVD